MFLMLSIVLMGIFLIFKRQLNLKATAATTVVAFFAYWELLPQDSVLFGLEFLPMRARTFSLDTWVIISSWLIGLSLLFISISKARSFHRMIFALTLLVLPTLAFTYHLVLIQGMMTQAMNLEEKTAMAIVLDHNWKRNCQLLGYECSSFSPKSGASYAEKGIERQINDHLSFYLSQGGGASSFSLSRGMIRNRTPFTAAVLVIGEEGRLVVERQRSLKLLSGAERGFFIMMLGASVFWALASVSLILLHQRAWRKATKESP